jgi:tagaturonate reductase
VQSLNRSIQKLSRNRHPVKVLQFGNGNFLRGFADWMIQVANEKAGFNAGISVVNGSVGSNILSHPDTAYTVILRGIREEEFISQHYKIDIVNRVVDPHDDFESFLDEALNADLQFIISNVQDSGNSFSANDAAVSSVASTFPGKLTQLLFNRFNNKLDNSILILPTELHEQNGTNLKQEVQKYCMHWHLPLEFTTWLNRHITFCNTLVDRVVSGIPKKQKKTLAGEPVASDELIVEGEWFHQWVIEGPRWIEEVLPLKKAGLNVIYTDNLAPYHFRKERILTAVQTILACAGTLARLHTVRDTIEHRVIGRYIKRLIYDEIIPIIPGEIRALERYAEEVIDRLRNPAMDHRLDSLANNILHNFDSSVLPTMCAHIEKNGVVSNRLAYAMALLIYFLRPSATDERSGEYAEFIKPLWGIGGNTQNEMVERSRKIFNKRWEGKFKNVPNLAEQVGQNLYAIAELGVIESLKK